MLGKWYQGKFIRIEEVNPTVRRYWVEIPELEQIHFKPGQFMTFDLPIHEKRHRRLRSYSIASYPDGSNVLEFVIVLLEGGAGSTYLFNEVELGSELTLRGPLGVFTLPETLDPSKEICFICTGTGVAPFRSMLQDIRNRAIPYPPMRLIFGTRYEEGILYREEMEQLTKELTDFNYHITLSRAENWDGEKGYVHPLYERLYANNKEVIFYLCGWNVMLDEAKQRLLKMGFDKKQIRYESYG